MSYTSLPDASRVAVITGVGVVAPNGIGKQAWWKATKAGASGIARITRFDPSKYSTQLAGEVADFNADDWIERRLQVQTDRWTHMALAATQMAFEDADFDPAQFDEWSTSAITASSSGGNAFGQKEIQALWGKGPKFVGAYQSIAWFYAASTGQISIRYGLKGPCGVVIAEGAGGLEALQHSRRTIRRGVDTVVSGGLEAPIGPYALTCQISNGYLSGASDPEHAYRPFDERANGYVPGEGGAILLVESSERAQQRGAPQVYAEVAGYGATNDAYHWGKPAPDGSHFARAISIALEDADVSADEVDAVFADAFGVPEFDASEVAAIKSALGQRAATVPVTAPKSMVGRLYAGGASLDLAAAVLAMRDGLIPPTINLERAAHGCDLDFVTSAREAKLGVVLVVARGYGGFNGAVVLRRVE
ncbi:MAG: ketosynthase chain-length factor [Solirubrobacterales bacterium]|nr:ketosynthase chain-length factor [Solirubrobacterales bacterium]